MQEYFSSVDGLYRADQADGSTVIHDDNRGVIYTLGSGCEAKPNGEVNATLLSNPSPNPGARIIRAYNTLKNKMKIGTFLVLYVLYVLIYLLRLMKGLGMSLKH